MVQLDLLNCNMIFICTIAQNPICLERERPPFFISLAYARDFVSILMS